MFIISDTLICLYAFVGFFNTLIGLMQGHGLFKSDIICWGPICEVRFRILPATYYGI